MTPSEIEIARALGQCSFLPGSWDKRFCRDMAFAAEHSPDAELTDRQLAHMLRLAHKYRRQIPARVIETALDEMERATDRRVAEGKGALPDFTPVRKARRSEQAKRLASDVAPVPLFERLDESG